MQPSHADKCYSHACYTMHACMQSHAIRTACFHAFTLHSCTCRVCALCALWYTLCGIHCSIECAIYIIFTDHSHYTCMTLYNVHVHLDYSDNRLSTPPPTPSPIVAMADTAIDRMHPNNHFSTPAWLYLLCNNIIIIMHSSLHQ